MGILYYIGKTMLYKMMQQLLTLLTLLAIHERLALHVAIITIRV